MPRRKSRIRMAACLILGGAYLCAGGNLTCGSFGADAAVSALDMCFMFDCTSGILGGVIDPCGQIGGSDSGTNTTGQTGDTVSGGTFFADCPENVTGG